MHDRGRARPLDVGHKRPVDQRLAEAYEARQRRLQFVRDVGQKFPLRNAGALHRLGHAIECRAEHPDLVGAADANSS